MRWLLFIGSSSDKPQKHPGSRSASRRRILVAAIACLPLLPLLAGRSLAFDFSSAALEKTALHLSDESSPSPFPSGLLGEDLAVPETKSASLAVLYSLLLPGLGQSYLGEKTQAKVFYALDIAIWTSFVVFTVQANLREDEYQEYARAFGGVTNLDHSDDYYGILTEFDSFREYEDDIKGEGRLDLYPDVDVSTLDRYFIDHRVSDYEMWVWQSSDHRRAYQDRRSASRRADRRALYSLAAALANRVASAFFAYRSAARLKPEGGAEQSRFSIELGAPQRHASDGFLTGISVVRNF